LPALYCKSWEDDLLRAQRLVVDIGRFIRGGIKFYVSVLAADREHRLLRTWFSRF
jgi:hypothetical protein